MTAAERPAAQVLEGVRRLPAFFLQPVRLFRTYDRANLRPDLIAGLTVAVILLPQAMAYALIAELPPYVGLYAAIIAAIIGALWGSSNHLHTGPTNAISLLILATLFTLTAPGTADYVLLAGLMAVMVGLIQVAMGLARLGVLVNFVSHSVIVGFSAGAGVLIAAQQLRHLLGLEFSSHNLIEAVHGVVVHLPEVHLASLVLGVGTMLLIVTLRLVSPRLPGPLIAIVSAAAVVGLLGLDHQGVVVVGELPRGLPPLAGLPALNLQLVGQLAPGALAVAAIGLVEAMSIARSIAGQSGQRLDSNQEFVGQGLSNLATGFLSGYPVSGSFTRSAVNYDAGARTPLASAFSGLFVLVAMFVFGPLAAYVPRTALAGVLILTAYSMIDRREIARIWRGARADAGIMIITFLSTLFLPLEFAVLAGILISFAVYIITTSVPKVVPVLPDQWFRHFTHQPQGDPCPQLAILDLRGDLYFGAVSHIEAAVTRHLTANPEQRFVLLRMHSVDHCDFSGIHALKVIARTCRERGGDLFLVRVQEPVRDVIQSTGLSQHLGAHHLLTDDEAVAYLFHHIIDPAICIYECDVRAFRECQNLPKRTFPDLISCRTATPDEAIDRIPPPDLWRQICEQSPPLIVDVREPREYRRGSVPQARSIPLPSLLAGEVELAGEGPLVLVCQSGRRSRRAACVLRDRGYDRVAVLQGGMRAWEAAGLLVAFEESMTGLECD
ncbi:MAG: sulfate permease [Anaerolineae bacterium]|jgi:SulP family sulfate permease